MARLPDSLRDTSGCGWVRNRDKRATRDLTIAVASAGDRGAAFGSKVLSGNAYHLISITVHKDGGLPMAPVRFVDPCASLGVRRCLLTPSQQQRSIVRLTSLRYPLTAVLLPTVACFADVAASPQNPRATDDSQAIAIPSEAATAAQPPPPASDAAPLPVYQTEEERSRTVPVPFALNVTRAPEGDVYPPAEYAPSTGVLFRASDYGDGALRAYFVNLIRGVLAGGATPILLEPDYAGVWKMTEYLLRPYGIDPASVAFEVSPGVETMWTRDYGPWHVYVDGQRSSIDMGYYNTRPYDDAVPMRLGEAWDEDVYRTPLSTEGGNFMTDGLGTCWASRGVIERNGLSRVQIEAIYRDYVGCRHMTFVGPLPDEGTTHIDMFSKVLNQDTILVGFSTLELGAWRDEIDALDAAAETYRTTPKPGGGAWHIARVPMSFGFEGYGWNSKRVYYTHTNSLIVNNQVLVPTYGRGTDETALQAYRDLMPGYAIVGVDASSVIGFNGAIHCTAMQIPQPTYRACGDGVIAGGEQCEPSYLRGKTCASLGSAGGSLACRNDCTWDLTACRED